ncbi:MAG: hypothetical protein PHE29_05445 [Tissierellia bacterium]|nr:hypothetical protein [Tissierellia bacterium]MDD4780815.1 hypothetical protein [Tissierellia bacterium]
MKLKTWQKNILSALVIVVGGFILFNLAFLLAAFVINGLMSIMGMPENATPPALGKVLYIIIIAIISWIIFISKFNIFIKATFLTLPLMIALVMVGIALYGQSKLLIIAIGAIIISAVILYLRKKKLPWQYYFATFYDAVLALCIIFFNIQI